MKPESTKIACLPVLLGAMVGFVVVLLWSRSQVRMLGNIPLRGEAHSRIVFTYSMVGAVVGGLLVGILSAVRQKMKKRREAQRSPDGE